MYFGYSKVLADDLSLSASDTPRRSPEAKTAGGTEHEPLFAGAGAQDWAPLQAQARSIGIRWGHMYDKGKD